MQRLHRGDAGSGRQGNADPVTAIRLFMPYFVMAFLTWNDGIAFCQSGVTVHSSIPGSLPREAFSLFPYGFLCYNKS